MFFGTTQGVLAYLHRYRLPFRSNWLAAPGSAPIFLLYTAAAFHLSGLAGQYIFADQGLRRLKEFHEEDKAHIVEGQKL